MSLLSALCLALEADEESARAALDGSDDDDDGLGGIAEELGLGGAGLKGRSAGHYLREGGVDERVR
jgi:gamma-tubulin complex component 2